MTVPVDIAAARAVIVAAHTSQSLAGLEANYERVLALLPRALDELERVLALASMYQAERDEIIAAIGRSKA